MIDFKYLYKGLCGLARAHRAGPLAGHLGAAVLAGYFFGEDHPGLADKVYSAIEKDLNQIIQGEESLWFDPRKAGITIPSLFDPFPEERPQEEGIRSIAGALTTNIDKLRESGHNVIFAAIALRALHDHPMYATPSIITGIRKLVETFDAMGPGRGYYGKQRGWIAGDKVALPIADEFPQHKDQHAMAEAAIDELIRSASMRRQGFGGLFHIINHAAALTELSLFGYRDLVQRGLAAHHQHVRLWRSLPDVEGELGPLKRAKHDPRTPEYWSADSPSQWSARLTHRIKTLYGFFTLLRLTKQSATRKQAEEQFLYLMT
ncbi:MAG: hypothetical protein A2V98_09635 [Planctomycetes bacterium RBG_16_64_12]|nr:MAG: hypothetical protein A2V98_09635 [Planctomycetes bacterium RBG_16_64_12]